MFGDIVKQLLDRLIGDEDSSFQSYEDLDRVETGPLPKESRADARQGPQVDPPHSDLMS